FRETPYRVWPNETVSGKRVPKGSLGARKWTVCTGGKPLHRLLFRANFDPVTRTAVPHLSWMDRFLASSLVRRCAASLLAVRARRRIAELDHLNVARCQERALRGLVHRAAATPFGRAHDFSRIRTWDDYRRLVRVGSAAEIALGNGEAKPRDMLTSN